MKKILLSLGTIIFVGSIGVAATAAFFNDTETSTGNTFAAGALDLRVDSTAHFNSMVCVDTDEDGMGDTWEEEPGFEAGPEHYPQPGDPCNGTWTESDLIANAIEWRFFNFDDLKPGDEGENTISLHVYDNNAWGCFLVDNVVDADNTCTEPESEDADDSSCNQAEPLAAEGELGAALTFDAWLDQGATPGFQNIQPDPNNLGQYINTNEDSTEGDNIFQEETEGPLFWNDETVDEASEGPFDIREVLAAGFGLYCPNSDATGDTDYESCHGLAQDGRMVGSTTYYFGLAWNIPAETGNEIQTDSLVLDMTFEAAQHRNNPNFQCAQPEPVDEVTAP